jgi:hypothetical protein
MRQKIAHQLKILSYCTVFLGLMDFFITKEVYKFYALCIPASVLLYFFSFLMSRWAKKYYAADEKGNAIPNKR